MTFDTDSGGRVWLTWSTTPVANAILSAVPKQTVPAHKFKGGGKTEVIRGANEAKKFYEGVCSFVKAVAAYGSEVKREAGSTPHPLLVVLLDKNNTVVKLNGNSAALLTMKTVAAVNKDSAAYDAKTLNPTLFTSKALSSGGASLELIKA